MKARYFYFIGAALLFAGCNKEMVDADQIGGVRTVLEVGLPDSKTYMGENEGGSRSVYWSNGDQIAVNGVASEELAELPAGTTSTTFTIDGVLDTPYKIIYPASIYEDATHVTLPAVQTYKAGGFADGMFPMAGYTADGSDITLNHLCALVKISVLRASGDGADTDNIACVRFKGRNAERVSGTFEIDYPNTALVEDSGTGVSLEVRVVKSLATSTTTAVDYYLVVPAREYENGFDVIVQDVNGHIMTKSKTESKTFAAGHFYKMAAFEFVPTGTELGVEISSAEELIAFATAYNNEEYEPLGNNLLATVTDDIVFDATSSALFDATGGIGCVNADESTNYFNGLFDGNNMTISGYTGIAPIFAYTGSGGKVKNLTLAADCDKIIPSDNSGTLFGAFVAYHKGRLEGCTSEADLSFSNISTSGHFYGGLVARNHGGEIVECTMNGNVICPAELSISAAGNMAGIGGIAGRSNGSDSKIDKCHFNGNITISDGNTYGGIIGVKGVYFWVGGIVGHLQEGVVSSCETGNGTMDIRGTFNVTEGGIAGWTEQSKPATVRDCTNNLSVKFTSDGGRSVITPTWVAGIVGSCMGATVSGCVNNGSVATKCDANLLYLGGIAASGEDSAFSNCRNNGSLTHTNVTAAAQTARYISIGGIVGIFSENALKATSLDGCVNNASITCNQLGTSTNLTVDIGGIVGKNDLKAITITNCKNSVKGAVRVDDTANKYAFARTALGGILGYSHVANTVLRGCYNSARIRCQYSQGGTNNRPTYVGGIVGFLGVADKKGCSGVAGLEIDDCHNMGQPWNQNYNNTVTLEGGPFCGGVVGAVLGTSNNKASVHDCTSSSPATNDSTIVYLRGIVGGIAGYAANANLQENVSSSTISGNNNATGAGGIVGWSVASSLEDCEFSGIIGPSGSNVAPKNVGGLIYLMDANSSMEGCKVNGASLTKGTNAAATAAAVLVSNAALGATITDCGVKGTLDGAAITLSSNMVTTDGGATVSGTYLLD